MGIEFTGGRKVDVNEKHQAVMDREKLDQVNDHERIKKEHPEVFGKFEKILGDIDLEVLWRIFEEYAQKSGIDSQALNYIPKSSIKLSSNLEANAAAYDPYTNFVLLNHSNVAQEGIDEIDVLLVLSHELVHATAEVDVWSPEEDAEKASFQVGYDVRFRRAYSVAFNEGVTERIAQEIATEYIRRTGGDIKKLRSKIEKVHERIFQYSIFMSHVDEIARRLDEYAGLQEGTAWKAIVRGAYSGLFLRDDIFKDFFEEKFSKDFLSRYEDIGYNTDLEVIGGFDGDFSMTPFHLDEEQIQKWLQHLGLKK